MSLEIHLDKQESQDIMEKFRNEISSMTGISEWQADSAVKATINAYDAYIQKKLEEEK